jgi:hypothetical protein
MAKTYTVSDGKLVLNLEPAAEGGYVVTSPLEPELIPHYSRGDGMSSLPDRLYRVEHGRS